MQAGCPELTPIQLRFREILELSEFGIQIYRQRMRREHPDASPEEIDAMVQAWLLTPRDSRRASRVLKAVEAFRAGS